MSACLAIEEPLDVAFLGPQGTFTQAAAVKHFGRSIRTTPMRAIDEVFREVESGNADYGVVPVENSSEGVVNHTLDMFLRSPLSICGEVALRIHHHLLAKQADLSRVNTVYSHQQSLAQCREWLDLNLPRANRVAVSSNGEAARLAGGESAAAAIAGEYAAEIYELPVLERNIEDDPNNVTRFLVIGRQAVPRSGHDRTSLLVSSRNRIGSLHKLIEPISRHGLMMTRIESRPSRQETWGYLFFIDVDGHLDDPAVNAALADLEAGTTLFRVLGSYPKAVL
jgi:chorismate mutase/prephenate dehydratase